MHHIDDNAPTILDAIAATIRRAAEDARNAPLPPGAPPLTEGERIALAVAFDTAARHIQDVVCNLRHPAPEPGEWRACYDGRRCSLALTCRECFEKYDGLGDLHRDYEPDPRPSWYDNMSPGEREEAEREDRAAAIDDAMRQCPQWDPVAHPCNRCPDRDRVTFLHDENHSEPVCPAHPIYF